MFRFFVPPDFITYLGPVSEVRGSEILKHKHTEGRPVTRLKTAETVLHVIKPIRM